jgi:hypothetical protein
MLVILLSKRTVGLSEYAVKGGIVQQLVCLRFVRLAQIALAMDDVMKNFTEKNNKARLLVRFAAYMNSDPLAK